MIKQHNFVIYTNNHVGILNRITAIFARINLNIDALSVGESEQSGVFKHDVQVRCDHATAMRLRKQIERQIEVINAGVH